MTTGSDPRRPWPGPLYLDTSALVKLYLPEDWSEELDAMLSGRDDLVVSKLALTETASAQACRRREGGRSHQVAVAVQRQVLADLESELFLRAALAGSTHRAAKRLLLGAATPRLRAADALHLALAIETGASGMVTFDRVMADAAHAVDLVALPGLGLSP